MDYAWLTSIAHMARKGVSIFGNRYYSFMLLGLSVALIYLGTVFIAEAMRI